MNRLFYHGFEPEYYLSEGVRRMIDIINSGGVKLRNESRGIDSNILSHICLYRKNMNFDYSSPEFLIKSARAGWIDNCMVFVISDDIKATYIPPNVEVEGFGLKTNLVDEWRCLENIPLDKIIGIALPLNSIQITLDGKNPLADENEVHELKEAIKELKKICAQYGLKTFNSEIKDFTDILDKQYSISHLSEQEQEID